MKKFAITSDLHFDPRGYLTPPRAIYGLVEKIREENVDLIVIAGDIAHGIADFEACLFPFRQAGALVAVLAGNHDLWFDQNTGIQSADLWESALENATKRQHAIWLEKEIIQIGNVAVVGSLAWYDYSAVDPVGIATNEEIQKKKIQYNNDANYITWSISDVEFANQLSIGLCNRIQEAASRTTVESILVVTHVPILECQMERKPYDRRWSFSNAYFGNLTIGNKVLQEKKVKAIISGHTHIGKSATITRDQMPDVDAFVVPSDYGEPAYVTISL